MNIMYGIAISTHPDYPCIEAKIFSAELGLLAYYSLSNSNLSYWGKGNNITFNHLFECIDGNLTLSIESSSNGLDTMSSTITVSPRSIKGILVVGILPNGEICLWDRGNHESTVIKRVKSMSQSSDSDFWFKNYTYRFILNSRKTNFTISAIKVERFDGTYKEWKNNSIGTYMPKSLPRRLWIKASEGKANVNIGCWIDYHLISNAINKVIGAHPETKTDFIIRIDAENKKYELALYRQGLKEPVIIPKSAYQLIVFKNKFEDYRSENYNQPRGAWIW